MCCTYNKIKQSKNKIFCSQLVWYSASSRVWCIDSEANYKPCRAILTRSSSCQRSSSCPKLAQKHINISDIAGKPLWYRYFLMVRSWLYTSTFLPGTHNKHFHKFWSYKFKTKSLHWSLYKVNLHKVKHFPKVFALQCCLCKINKKNTEILPPSSKEYWITTSIK